MVGRISGILLRHHLFLILTFSFSNRSFDAVHDLPQIYQRPQASALLHALELLSFRPSNFSGTSSFDGISPRVAEQGVPGYLTSIVSSSLSWIKDDEAKESIWNAASSRLSERSGRNAMPAITRTFEVNDDLSISLHEPTLTEDNLGLKTWTSSLLLSRRLGECRRYLPREFNEVLELGAGTGLVGIAAACLWRTHVLLTDLVEIVPNLQRNLEQNGGLIERSHGSAEARALDWADGTHSPRKEDDKFMVILAADPIYSSDHPKILVNTVRRWICPDPRARFIVELPLRDRYDGERQDLRESMKSQGFELVIEGTDTGYDDWHGRDGEPALVECWWSIWKPAGQE